MKLDFITGKYDADHKKRITDRLKSEAKENGYSTEKILINEKGWLSRYWGRR